MKYIIGIIMIAAGVIFIWKTDWFLKSFGRIGWAEQKLGAGGTWTFYKILGLIVIFGAFLVISGSITTILDWIFG
ncbi:hypothetical protein ACFL2M_00240 [Patescibacteria group bacterium]